MTKPKLAAVTAIHAGDAIAASVRVVDAQTGETIANIIAADAEAGKVTRFAVEDGLLVREGDTWKVIEEDRQIRLEQVEVPADAAAVLVDDAAVGAESEARG